MIRPMPAASEYTARATSSVRKTPRNPTGGERDAIRGRVRLSLGAGAGQYLRGNDEAAAAASALKRDGCAFVISPRSSPSSSCSSASCAAVAVRLLTARAIKRTSSDEHCGGDGDANREIQCGE